MASTTIGGTSERSTIDQQSSASRIEVIFVFHGPYDSRSFNTILFVKISPEPEALIPLVADMFVDTQLCSALLLVDSNDSSMLVALLYSLIDRLSDAHTIPRK